MKRFVIGIAAMAVLVCAAYLVYGIFGFLALTQIRDVEFPAPNERQIAYVAEKLLSPFVRLYECENGRGILTVGNVPGSTADGLAALGAD